MLCLPNNDLARKKWQTWVLISLGRCHARLFSRKKIFGCAEDTFASNSTIRGALCRSKFSFFIPYLGEKTENYLPTAQNKLRKTKKSLKFSLALSFILYYSLSSLISCLSC